MTYDLAWLRLQRTQAKLTQAHLASRLGVHQTYISLWETGAKPLTAEDVTRLRAFFDALQKQPAPLPAPPPPLDEPKRLGRPPGSKNKNKTSEPAPSDAPAQPKRRGRPLGSKNNPASPAPEPDTYALAVSLSQVVPKAPTDSDPPARPIPRVTFARKLRQEEAPAPPPSADAPKALEGRKQIANFIWSICNLLRGPYKRNEYRKVILPLTVLRRLDCVLAPTRVQALRAIGDDPKLAETSHAAERKLAKLTGCVFYNTSRFSFVAQPDPEFNIVSFVSDTAQVAANLSAFIDGFSPSVREVWERFAFGQQIARLDEKNLLFKVVQRFAAVDLSPTLISNEDMGFIFEELIRIGAEQSNEEAGEHFTPREVIRLMVNLLLNDEKDLAKPNIIRTIYDPACGTGGMLSCAEQYLLQLNPQSKPKLFGQDLNDEAWAVCQSDMLIKGHSAQNIKLGDTFTHDAFRLDEEGSPWTFDYMLANPPFGVEWKQQQEIIEAEHETHGYAGRFGAGLPRINDGSFLFLQHMLSKMRAPEKGGSRIAVVFNGSPLFTGDAGSGESEIRRWIIQNDWLEAIVALPDQLFYNTGISTYIWILSNRKIKDRKCKIQLIDARNCYIKMKKSLGNKRNKLGDPHDDPREPDHIGQITRLYGDFTHDQAYTPSEGGASTIVSKIFDNDAFGFRKITVERPLRLNFRADHERILALSEDDEFQNLNIPKANRRKPSQAQRDDSEQRQQALLDLLASFSEFTGAKTYLNRTMFGLDLVNFILDYGLTPKLSPAELALIFDKLSERDEQADIVLNNHGRPTPDAELRDTEQVPLGESIDDYMAREVLPHVPDAWCDTSKTKIGYEIPFTRHFYRYEPPRLLEEIQQDIQNISSKIIFTIKEVFK